MADFDKLYKVLPTDPKTWLIADISIWLEFIGLPQYKEEFGFYQFK